MTEKFYLPNGKVNMTQGIEKFKTPELDEYIKLAYQQLIEHMNTKLDGALRGNREAKTNALRTLFSFYGRI